MASHLLALVGSLSTGLQVPAKLVLVAAVVGSSVFHLRGAYLTARKQILILYGEQDGWSFQVGESLPVKAELLPSSVSSRWISVLHFRTTENRFQNFLILADSLSPEDYRRMRMILKIAGKHDGSGFI